VTPPSKYCSDRDNIRGQSLWTYYDEDIGEIILRPLTGVQNLTTEQGAVVELNAEPSTVFGYYDRTASLPQVDQEPPSSSSDFLGMSGVNRRNVAHIYFLPFDCEQELNGENECIGIGGESVWVNYGHVVHPYGEDNEYYYTAYATPGGTKVLITQPGGVLLPEWSAYLFASMTSLQVIDGLNNTIGWGDSSLVPVGDISYMFYNSFTNDKTVRIYSFPEYFGAYAEVAGLFSNASEITDLYLPKGFAFGRSDLTELFYNYGKGAILSSDIKIGATRFYDGYILGKDDMFDRVSWNNGVKLLVPSGDTYMYNFFDDIFYGKIGSGRPTLGYYTP
jgi:hypothetical protein